MSDPHDQSGSGVRLEWGLVGAQRLSADVTVVVDVLSFTTALGVAVDRGTTVFPYAWKDASAATYAAEHDAVLAVGRHAARPGEVSLSPGTIRAADRLDRLVLPSPNGSTIAAALGAGCLAGSLRNRRAVADALPPGGSVLLVPAGERWPDGSLRPAVEDLWGAGGIAAALEDLGRDDLSEEARAAAAAYRRVADGVRDALVGCSSGRELVEGGFGGDVDVAAELDTSDSVPRLGVDGAFTAA